MSMCTPYYILISEWINSKYGTFTWRSENCKELEVYDFPDWKGKNTYIKAVKQEYWNEFENWCAANNKIIPPETERRTFDSLSGLSGIKIFRE